jgi:hypothetical protein
MYKIPSPIKYFWIVFTTVLVTLYLKIYGPQNFLWFSDIGLFLTVCAVLLESALPISIAVISILPLELLWIVHLFVQVCTGNPMLGTTNYMFNSNYPLFVRCLSLFHMVLPPFWIWYVRKMGYDKRAPYYATILVWIVLVLTYCFTDPAENTNWVFMPHEYHWTSINPIAWLLFLMLFGPLCIILPMHIFMTKISRK